LITVGTNRGYGGEKSIDLELNIDEDCFEGIEDGISSEKCLGSGLVLEDRNLVEVCVGAEYGNSGLRRLLKMVGTKPYELCKILEEELETEPEAHGEDLVCGTEVGNFVPVDVDGKDKID